MATMGKIIKAFFFLALVQVISGAPIFNTNVLHAGEELENSDGFYVEAFENSNYEPSAGEELENSKDNSVESLNEDYGLSNKKFSRVISPDLHAKGDHLATTDSLVTEGDHLATTDSLVTEGDHLVNTDSSVTKDSLSDHQVIASYLKIIAMFRQWKHNGILVYVGISLGLMFGLLLVSGLAIYFMVQYCRLKRKMKDLPTLMEKSCEDALMEGGGASEIMEGGGAPPFLDWLVVDLK